MIINPEFAAAQEISRLLRFPSAIKIDTFARGRVELLKFKVLPEFKLDGMSVSQISDAFRSDILVCAIESRDNVSILVVITLYTTEIWFPFWPLRLMQRHFP